MSVLRSIGAGVAGLVAMLPLAHPFPFPSYFPYPVGIMTTVAVISCPLSSVPSHPPVTCQDKLSWAARAGVGRITKPTMSILQHH